MYKAKQRYYKKCKQNKHGVLKYTKNSFPNNSSSIENLKNENESIKDLSDRINGEFCSLHTYETHCLKSTCNLTNTLP